MSKIQNFKSRVSVILVSYNTRELTTKSIESIYSSNGFKKTDLEVIVVDNNSQDDTVNFIKQNFSQVRVITNKVNLGFGSGNNQGAKIANGKYLLFLNTDAFLQSDTLKKLISVLEQNPDVASVGPQLRHKDGSLQQSAGYFPTPLRVLAWMWWLDKLPLVKQFFPQPYHLYDLEWYKNNHYPDWLMGACMLFRRDEFLDAQGFDEQIFMYAEEVELYRRIHDATGKKNYFTTETWITHLGSASTKKANAFRLTYELRGIEYIYRKHYPSLYWFIKFVIITGVILRIILYSIVPGRRDALQEYLKYFGK